MYKPEQDSFFFAEFLENYFSSLTSKQKQNLTYLDMGTGSGILSQTAIKSKIPKKNITAVDIDKESIEHVKNKLKIQTIKSNLFSKLKDEKYNLVTFNPPYLPEHKHDKKPDTTGGKQGDETIIRFLKQAKQHLKPRGKILFLISSLTPQNKIKKYKPKVLARKKIFFEELLILEVKEN